MAEGDFQVVFRGELTGERSGDEVRQQLADLFRMPEEKVAALFSGKPIVVKRNLDEATARKFEAAFRKAGALCEIRPAGDTASADPGSDRQTTAEPAPAGQQAQPTQATAGTATDSEATRRASLAAAGDPNQTLLELGVPEDLSGLDVDTSDAPLSSGETVPAPDIDIGDLSVVDNDSGNLSEHEPPTPPDIDTSELALEDPEP